MEKKIAFVVNPISGTSHKEKIIDYLHSKLDNSTVWNAVYYTTKSERDPYLAAERFKNEGFDVVVAIGGDGTVNQIAKALIGSNVRLGIIPVGSGNGMARHLKIPMLYQKAIDVILQDHYTEIDAGMINDQYFFCTAGLGFEAVIGAKFNSAGTRGLLTYMETCTREYMRYRREQYEIDIDGHKFSTKAFLITFANCAQWGNNAFIAPAADASDGMLDMVIWKRAPLVYMPVLTAELFLKTIIYSEYIDTYRCKRVEIKREREGLIQFDGESSTMGSDVTATIHPKAVKVIVPVLTDFE